MKVVKARRTSPLRRAFCRERCGDLPVQKETSPDLEVAMPRGDKSSYSNKQKRMAEHIEEGYEKRGVSENEAERRAWATVNKETHGGKKSGSGRGKSEDHSPSRKGGRLGGKAAASRPAAERSASAKKAARTRKKRAA
jgi:plasmid stabilization system protein ParE